MKIEEFNALPNGAKALRIVILRNVRRDLIEILKEFDGPESKA